MIADTLPANLRRAISPYTGIVRTLEECLRASSEPAIHCAAVGVGPGLAQLAGGGGAGLTRREAACAAVGEALERYAAGVVPTDRLVVASARELGTEAVAPERFALFSPAQYAQTRFPFRPFTADTRTAWVDARTLPNGRPAWVPAELVFLGDVGKGGPRIGYATSSGTACAPTRDEALARGLCELLERDAFMIVWANRLSLPLLDWSGDGSLAALDRRLFAPAGLHYRAVDLSAFHSLPSVLAVVRAPSGHPGALGIGAGTAATIQRAWWKGLAEAFSARAAGAKLALLADGAPLHAEDVLSFEDHIRYHSRPNESAVFLDAADATTATEDVTALEGWTESEHVAALCARVAAAGASAYAVDVTSADVRELGLTVQKVIAPELCALDVAHRARFLGGRRLYLAAYELGLRDRPLREDEVNPEPHPFP